MKGQKFLNITGILMIIGGAVSFVLAIIALVGVAALVAMLGAEGGGLLYLSAGLLLAGAVAEFIAGIIGVKNCAKPEKANTCITWGIIVAAFCLVGNILSVVGGDKIDVFSMLLGIALPVLYIVGAVLNKKSV